MGQDIDGEATNGHKWMGVAVDLSKDGFKGSYCRCKNLCRKWNILVFVFLMTGFLGSNAWVKTADIFDPEIAGSRNWSFCLFI